MCGIVGCISENGNALELVVEGSSELSYRGFDSNGIAARFGDRVVVHKKAGVTALEIGKKFNGYKNDLCSFAIAHNRWATTGKPSDINAHPHTDMNEEFFIVHNGIVRNVDNLRDYLHNFGVLFKSDTDTEVIINLIANDFKNCAGDFCLAVNTTMRRLEGDNAIVVFSKNHPEIMIATKKGNSPLLVSKTEKDIFIVSDIEAIKRMSGEKKIVFSPLEDGDIVVLRKNDFNFLNRSGIEKIEINNDFKPKNDIDSFFMKKEIFEQKKIIKDISKKGLQFNSDSGRKKVLALLKKVNRFHFIGCGTSFFACKYAEKLFNSFDIKASAYLASELNVDDLVIEKNDVCVYLSQSGETLDILRVVDDFKNTAHLFSIGIVNKQFSSLERLTDTCIYLNAGKEVAVASTKAFTAQVMNIFLFGFEIAKQREVLTDDAIEKFKILIKNLPSCINIVLNEKKLIKDLAIKMSKFKNQYFLGRRFNSFVAEEGALKLKEISYLHAEAYPAGEMKHGPIALIDEDFLCVVIAPNDSTLEHSRITVDEIKARGGKVFLLTNKDVKGFSDIDYRFILPEVNELLSPITTTIVLQLFAYYMAIELGKNPDQPRNLAKSVTVE
ncbi:glutamine--fructose-6-phosphate transaminase (isomerizing) [Candidatus Parcubacteria bacterium]|nr:glutamine--fructose-6-phosphate transaminase (isomerizing) [Candidatus Parcubacteria bacterium]